MGTIAGIAAYIGFCLGVLTLFSMADKAASPEGKARARALLDFGWKDTVTRWPSVFVEMFDSIFGKRHFTWKCFGRSCLASLVAVVICTLIFWWLRPDYVSAEITKLGVKFVFLVLFGAILLNLFPDYVSLLETRAILRNLTKRGDTWAVVSLAILGDFVATFLVFALTFVTVILAMDLYDGKLHLWPEMLEVIGAQLWSGFVFETRDHEAQMSFGIFLWTSYFTSIWLWLYALATFAGKLLLPILNRIESFKKLVDLDNKPFLALGWLSVMIITVLFAVGAVVKACV